MATEEINKIFIAAMVTLGAVFMLSALLSLIKERRALSIKTAPRVVQ